MVARGAHAVLVAAVALLMAHCGGCRSGTDAAPARDDGGGTIDSPSADRVDDALLGHPDSASDAPADTPPPEGSADAPETWLVDKTLWEEIPSLKECSVALARLPSTRFPRRLEEPCGAGCRSLIAGLPGLLALGGFEGGIALSDGTLELRLQSFEIDQPRYRVAEVVDLKRNKTLSSHRTDFSKCNPVNNAQLGYPDVAVWFDSKSENALFARWDYRSNRLATFFDPPSTKLFIALGFLGDVDAWGYISESQAVHIGGGWSPPPLPSVDTTAGRNLRVEGSLFTWNATGAPAGSWIKCARAREPARLLYEASGFSIATHARSGTSLIWVQAQPAADYAQTLRYENVELWAGNLVGSPPSLVGPRRVASLPYTSSPNHIVSDGVHVAFGTCVIQPSAPAGIQCSIGVVRLADGKLWTLGPRDSTMKWRSPVGINATEVFIPEGPNKAGADLTGIVILRLDELDGLASRFPPIAG